MNIYEYQKPVGKIDDIPELRDEFIAAFDAKTKNETARFGLIYARHILDVAGFTPPEEVAQAYKSPIFGIFEPLIKPPEEVVQAYKSPIFGIFEPRIKPPEEVAQALEAVQKWIDGKVNYHEARNISFAHLYKNARGETDEIKKKFYKTIAQISCIPHVKAHGLWAADFAVTLINKIYPNDLDAVRKERQIQIDIIKTV